MLAARWPPSLQNIGQGLDEQVAELAGLRPRKNQRCGPHTNVSQRAEEACSSAPGSHQPARGLDQQYGQPSQCLLSHARIPLRASYYLMKAAINIERVLPMRDRPPYVTAAFLSRI